MKRLLTFASALLLFLSVQGQDTKTILGTWKIKNFQYGNHPNNNEANTSFKKFKSYTPTHFIVIEIDSKTNVTTTSIFGTYEIKNGIYTEKILNVNRESAGMIGQSFSFTLDFDGNDKMHSTGSFNGMKSSELWVRVSEKDQEAEPMDEEASTLLNPDMTKRKPLYVIKGNGKTSILNLEKSSESPLSLIPQKDITAIQVLKDATALELYKEPGRYGVIIIEVTDEKVEEILQVLKDKGVQF